MLVAAAVCPHPPLLVPGLASGAAAELDDLRTACDAAVQRVAQADPDLVVVVGDAPAVGPFPEDAWGSLAGYGVDVAVGEGPGPATLPLSLTLGRWLLDRRPLGRRPARTARLFFGVSADADAARCAQLGAALADRAPRVAILAMGDGTIRRTLKGPGYLDERAAPFDEAVAGAFRGGDPAALLGLDPRLADELVATGRTAWQVLAGAADGQAWTGDVLYAEAPYGVAYLVATLVRAQD